MTTNTYADLHDRYGAMVREVAGQVARQFSAKGGTFGHGWEVIEADDVEQAVYEQFLKTGITPDALDAMDEPRGYVRTTARLYYATNEAKRRRRDALADFNPEGGEDGTGGNFGWAANSPRYVSNMGDPQAELESTTLFEKAEHVIDSILASIASEGQRAIARLYYCHGLDAVRIAEAVASSPDAVRKGLQRAREAVGASAEASLRTWRAYAYPESKRPKSGLRWDGTPEDVRAGLLTEL